MPSRICRVASCRTKISYDEVYCDKHKATNDKTYNAYIRNNADNEKYTKFYASSEWKQVRKIKLMTQPLCEVCLREDNRRTKADMVHHKDEIRTSLGWIHRLDIDTLESICYNHHNQEEHAHSFKNQIKGSSKTL